MGADLPRPSPGVRIRRTSPFRETTDRLGRHAEQTNH